ncbi:MAG TPA: carboxypeptidase-like regulatory domain-containing protein, partial [Bacteroidia bacterium]|nr:carboxypeptidase-like regulatory domain-containing protein [Bacteroidia bacterium]
MKKYILHIWLCLLTTVATQAATPPGKASLSGKITDAETGSPIPGVTLYIPDLKIGTVTSIDGVYKIENLPNSRLLFQISFVGYKTITEYIDLSQVTTK